MVAALAHAAAGDLLQQRPPGLLGQLLAVLGHRHLLGHLLSDGQVLLQAQLQGFLILGATDTEERRSLSGGQAGGLPDLTPTPGLGEQRGQGMAGDHLLLWTL